MISLITPNLKTIAAIASAVCAVSYAIYFDHKRHQDPLFKQKLRERRRKAEEERKKKNTLKLPSLKSIGQEYIEHLKITADRLMDEGDNENAADHYAALITLSSQPKLMLSYHMQILPPEISSLLPRKMAEFQRKLANAFAAEEGSSLMPPEMKMPSPPEEELKLPENPTPDNMNNFCLQCLQKGNELVNEGDAKGHELLAYALALANDPQFLMQIFHQDLDEEAVAAVLAQLPIVQRKIAEHFAKSDLPKEGVLIEEDLE